ncbi:VWA domain-containing protein [Vibrio sp. SS-MA-C1-2]|uniref:VWA domain-containing protein n=1 Tax=Vibrio sp. SS-MA-C1-2 TaxID=2908646 RepID=UPI001F208FE9|nr:VWA domain-containing protein [Vibrio sp. SS-MA-C1-2]UJF18357.1 VWA domain-containing protein [Vibrio sp. SS-MA-C1-2]
MIEFTHPWLLVLLPLPYFVYRFSPAYQTQRSAVKVPFFQLLITILEQKPSSGAVRLSAKWWQKLTLALSWLLLVIAMMQPMWLGKPQTRELTGRDVMVVVDLSGSMDTNDFIAPDGKKQSRIDAAKKVLGQFSENRKGDRLGLILFGDHAYLQAPFTADHQAWLALLNETRVAMAGQSTHLGDAIGLAIKVFEEGEDLTDSSKTIQDQQPQKVAIILTDGNDTDSLVPPIEAAKIAASRDIRLHMIAMGDPQTVGEQALDMAVIDRVAKITGGESFQALSPAELQRIYQQISKLEPEVYNSSHYQPKVSLHYVPLIACLLIYLLAFTLSILNTKRKS